MILITGGTGLLGIHLVPELLNSGESVRVMIRESSDPGKVLPIWNYYYKNAEELLDKIEWFRGDITNKVDVFNALEHIDKVYHCAACVSFHRSKRQEMRDVNVLGTRNIVDMSLERGIQKLLHVSSIAAIGPGKGITPLTEENKWTINPKSDYSKTKTLAENEVWRGIFEGLNAVIINPSIILGAGYKGQNSYTFFERIYHGLKYYTKGATGFVDVRDVVKIMIMLMNSDITTERYIVSGINLSYRDLFIKISDAFGMRPPEKYATKFLTFLAFLGEFFISALTGKSQRITLQTARSAHHIKAYSSLKLINHTGFSFTDIDDTIKGIAGFFLDEIKTEKE
jgi:dihydroflavonol-4-reductase